MEEILNQYSPLILLVLIFAIFYFLMIRPQQKQQKQRQEMLRSLQKGDRVVTIGGIHGVIKEVHDDVIILRIADGVNIRFNRNGIDHIVTEEE